MYEEAASLGIDLMGYADSDHSSTEKQDRRKFLGVTVLF